MGNRIVKIFLWFVGIIAFLCMAGWFFAIKPLAQSSINSAAFSQGSPLSGGPLEVFFLGVKSPSTLTIHAKPIPLPFENTSLDFSLLSFFSLAPKMTLSSTLLGGSIDGSFSYKVSDSSTFGQLKAEAIQLAKYQLMSLLGVSSGELSLSFDMKGNNNIITPTNLFLKIKNFNKPNPTTLPTWISPISVKIPSITNAELLIEATCSNNECKSNKFSLTSSLGQASGNFILPIADNGNILANITISLTQSGRQELLPYFSILNQNLMSNPETPFVLKVSGPARHPKLSVVPIQNSL